MTKLKVAILEDNKMLLKELKQDLEETNFVDVIIWATNSDDFFEKIKGKDIEALVLDIDISGDSLTGIDIANHLKLPVLFVSGKTKDFFESIESLNLNSEKIIEHISKPITSEKLNKILPKFITQIKANNSSKYIFLNLRNIDTGERTLRNKITIDNIVYLGTDKNLGSESNNKVIYFKDRIPELLIDFTYARMEEIGLSSSTFITTHKSFRVNEKYIELYDNKHNHVQVTICNTNKKLEKAFIPVSENYQKSVRHKNK